MDQSKLHNHVTTVLYFKIVFCSVRKCNVWYGRGFKQHVNGESLHRTNVLIYSMVSAG